MVMVLPTSASSSSTSSSVPTSTRYCFPPVSMTAYMDPQGSYLATARGDRDFGREKARGEADAQNENCTAPSTNWSIVRSPIHYDPDANFSGDDFFDYSISDGHGGTATTSVKVRVTAVNDPPVAVNESFTIGQGLPATIAVLANDTDIDSATLTVAGVSSPPHGTAVANSDGTITYTPDAGYSGADAFAYTATDGSATSNLATVSITVTPASPPNPFHIGDLDGSTSTSGKTWTPG
jgi:hypothetical protein